MPLMSQPDDRGFLHRSRQQQESALVTGMALCELQRESQGLEQLRTELPIRDRPGRTVKRLNGTHLRRDGLPPLTS